MLVPRTCLCDFLSCRGKHHFTCTAESTPIGLGSIGALPVAILVWAIGLSLGGTTGYAINPARDLGPRLTLGLFLGGTLKTKADWGYSWVPVVGPFIGAALAAVFYNAIM